MRASDPLIINNLKRTDSVFNKVKVINENYFEREGTKVPLPYTIKEEPEEEGKNEHLL
jgi:hypothetical protein